MSTIVLNKDIYSLILSFIDFETWIVTRRVNTLFYLICNSELFIKKGDLKFLKFAIRNGFIKKWIHWKNYYEDTMRNLMNNCNKYSCCIFSKISLSDIIVKDFYILGGRIIGMSYSLSSSSQKNQITLFPCFLNKVFEINFFKGKEVCLSIISIFNFRCELAIEEDVIIDIMTIIGIASPKNKYDSIMPGAVVTDELIIKNNNAVADRYIEFIDKNGYIRLSNSFGNVNITKWRGIYYFYTDENECNRTIVKDIKSLLISCIDKEYTLSDFPC